jgi:hypothetical protein
MWVVRKRERGGEEREGGEGGDDQRRRRKMRACTPPVINALTSYDLPALTLVAVRRARMNMESMVL